MSTRNTLFSELDSSEWMLRVVDTIPERVEEIPEDVFRASEDEVIVENILSKVELLPINLFLDLREAVMTETTTDVRHDFDRMVRDKTRPCMVPAVQLEVSVPFTGTVRLWDLQPSPWSTFFPSGTIRRSHEDNNCGHLVIRIVRPLDSSSADQLKNAQESALKDVQTFISQINEQVNAHNASVEAKIRSYVNHRRERIDKRDRLAASLDIPLRVRTGMPSLIPLPIKKRLVRPLATVPDAPPEPGIREDDYANIMSIIRHAGRSFERTPQTHSKFNEEELRDVLLSNLNSLYEGDAAGEQFRKKGKTDICIEDKNRAAFVAECKVWRGEKSVTPAVDQLLSYLTWRDCKTALVFFNKDVKGFTDLQRKLPRQIRSHELQETEFPTNEAGEWRFLFRSASDPERKVNVHVFCFDLCV